MTIFTWLAALASKYGAIAFGVLLGFLARYADLLDQGREITWRIIVIDLLIFGMITSIASAIAIYTHMNPDFRAAFGAGFGYSGIWVCRFAGRRFKANAAATIGRVLPAIGGEDA
jgi:hypothetical protein